LTPEPGQRLLGDVRLLDDHGPPRRSRGRARLGHAVVWLVPALGMLSLVIGWPAAKIAQGSLVGNDGAFAGVGNYFRAFQDPQLATDLINTAIWAVVVPVLVTAMGYGIAILSRGLPVMHVFTLVLTPMALPLVVVSTAFRLLYSPSPRLGPATAILQSIGGWVGVEPSTLPSLLGPQLVTAALMSAFTWAWAGLAVVVFRAALDAIPAELEDAVRAEGADSWRVLRDVRWPFLRRTAAILVVLVAVAASRTFDLVLVMAPGSVQHEAEVLALYVLRQPNADASGVAAAVGVAWLLVVALGTMIAVRGARHAWPSPPRGASPASADPWWRRLPPHSRPRPGRVAVAGRLARVVTLWIVIGLWACPVVLLLLISLHAPIDPATRGWIAPLSWASYAGLAETELAESLLMTAALGIVVTAAVIAIASLAAHSLAWLHPYGEGAATAVLLVAAIVPIQAVAKPLHQLLSPAGLQGTVLALAIVHIGRGLPFAVLVLRNAFAAVPPDRIRQARLGGGNELSVLGRVVLPAARPALVAVAALEFIFVWNDLVVGLLFGGPGITPVGMVLFGQSRQFVTSAGTLAAACVVASIPPVAVVLSARRSIIAGLISGSVRR